MTGATPLIFEQYDEYRVYANQLQREAARQHLVHEARRAQVQQRLAGYFERITSHRYEKHQE